MLERLLNAFNYQAVRALVVDNDPSIVVYMALLTKSLLNVVQFS